MESESFRYRKAKRHEKDLLEQICKIALEGKEPHVFVEVLESIQNYELQIAFCFIIVVEKICILP